MNDSIQEQLDDLSSRIGQIIRKEGGATPQTVKKKLKTFNHFPAKVKPRIIQPIRGAGRAQEGNVNEFDSKMDCLAKEFGAMFKRRQKTTLVGWRAFRT